MYDHLKLLAQFMRLAGYGGFLVCIDELVVLSHRLSSAKSRGANYEAILRILNDSLQGNVEGLVLVFGATDDALEDRRRGLYSYEALATRLAPNQFASDTVRDLSAPVVKLQPLTPEDLFVLLVRIRDVFALGDPAKYLLPDEGLHAYLEHCARTLGDAYFRTPRESVTRFVGFLSLLEQDATLDWRKMLGAVGEVQVPPSTSAEASNAIVGEEDELVGFKL